ncbi:MAG TPA: zinc ABC transporter substrate-binding protein [Acidimicrobiales bacterium]|nr:zinc ABC transporter substrate-binding protein [Acidimicrobiales bacterium]
MRSAIALMVVGVLAITACGGDGAATADRDRPKVIAGFYPLAEAARRIGGDRITVTNLTAAGSEPHDLELTPEDVDEIEEATVVLYFGKGFQPAVAKAASRAEGRAIDVLNAESGLIQDNENEGGEKGTDPHVWLDPTLMKRIVEQVRDTLATVDPANRAGYEASAANYASELDALDAAYEQGLSQCVRKVIVTSHAAFGYLARRYGLIQDSIAGLDPESEPDPRRLAALADKVKAEGVTTIFSESLVSPKVADTLAREAGTRTAVLNPIEGLSEDEQRKGETYVSIMRRNLEVLRRALGCQ